MDNADARFTFLASILPLMYANYDLWIDLVIKLALATDEEIDIVVDGALRRINEELKLII